MKEIRLHKLGDLRCENITQRDLKDNEILVKVEACGICGSDIQRVFTLGAHVYPLVIGHEFAGTVVKTANKADEDLIGKKTAVFPIVPCMKCESCKVGHYAQCSHYNYLGSRCDGGFAEYCIVPSRWNLILSNNPDVSMETLCMVEPATVAQHAIRTSGIQAGQTAVITGAGPIGMMAARWAKIFGAKKVFLTDINEEKIEFSRNLGFEVINSMKVDAVKEIEKITDGKGVDIVIEGTGSSSGLNQAIQMVKPFGTVIMMGNPQTDTKIELPNHSLILRKELTLHGVWNSVYSSEPINEWECTVDMMDNGNFVCEDLITHRVSLDDTPKLFNQIFNREVTICKAIYSSKI